MGEDVSELFDMIAAQMKVIQVRIPEHPAGHSDNIRPPKPVYPATLV
jgi:hypothetical protein